MLRDWIWGLGGGRRKCREQHHMSDLATECRVVAFTETGNF